MPNPSSPNPPTGPRLIPPTSLASIRARLEEAEGRILNLENAGRQLKSLGIHQTTNGRQLSQTPHGHAATMDANSGSFSPSPNLASLTFHMQGALTIATSPPLHARYNCYIVGMAADLGTFSPSGGVVWQFLINGSAPVNGANHVYLLNGYAGGFLAVNPPVPLNAYTDLVSVQTTSIESGNADLVIHIELGSVVASKAVPIPT